MAKAEKKYYIKDETKRIEAIQLLIEKGEIKTWQDIFKYIPKTAIVLHLRTNGNRMNRLIKDPSTMPLEDLAEMAAFLQVDFLVIARMANTARVKVKAANKAKKK